MVTISQIQNGFVRFVDNEVATAFDGWQKTVIAGLSGLMAANFPNIVKMYGNHPMVIALGVYDAENNAVDVEALYNAFAPKFGTYKIPISIPKIATIKIGREEMEMLMHYIKES